MTGELIINVRRMDLRWLYVVVCNSRPATEFETERRNTTQRRMNEELLKEQVVVVVVVVVAVLVDAGFCWKGRMG